MFNRKNKKLGALILCLCLLGTLPACQRSHAQSLIKENDFEKLIEEAKNGSPDGVSIQEAAKEEKKDYVTYLENEAGNLKVNVNANIDIPNADKLSVYSVKQKPFTQEFIDTVRSELMGEQPIYDGSAIKLNTKSDIESKISFYQNQIDESGSQVVKAEFQKLIDELLIEYKDALEKLDITRYPSDGMLHSTKELYDKHSFYEWEYRMYPNGTYLHMMTDGSNGKYASLEVFNSPEDSNCLSYIKNQDGHKDGNSDYLPLDVFEEKYGNVDKYLNDNSYLIKPENYTGLAVGTLNGMPLRYVPVENETINGTKDDAIKLADDFLEKIGITEFDCYSADKTTEEVFSVKGDSGIILYRTSYNLTYYRKLDGVFLTQSSGKKHNLVVSDPDYENGIETKKSWCGESITVKVNDEGIVEFVYWSPLEITGTVVKSVNILPFEEVKTIFENTVVSSVNKYHDMIYYKDIELVRLSYSRISEGRSNYETGLIVPMWDFYGSSQYDFGGLSDKFVGPFKAINAIDGTVINPSDGLY